MSQSSCQHIEGVSMEAMEATCLWQHVGWMVCPILV